MTLFAHKHKIGHGIIVYNDEKQGSLSEKVTPVFCLMLCINTRYSERLYNLIDDIFKIIHRDWFS